MSISVQCEECGKSYQVRDEMAGRRGRCPKGHAIQVPLPESAAEMDEADDFAFSASPSAFQNDQPTAPKSARRSAARAPEPEPAAGDDFSAFPTQIAGSSVRDEEAPAPKTGRHRRPEVKASAKEGKPSLMPLILGGILAVLGIGGGTTLLIVSRGEVGPLKERAEAADKKAAAAEERAQKAESLKLLAESNLEAAKKNPPRDPAVAETQKLLKAAEKRATEAEKKLTESAKTRDAAGGASSLPKELDPDAPGGKNDPVMPGGKLEADRPMKKEMDKPAGKKDVPGKAAADAQDGIPLGGKNWTVPGSIMLGMNTLKAGDRIWLWPQDDVAPKVMDGKLTIKVRWQLRKGKELPEVTGVALMVQEARQIRTFASRVTLVGQGDVAEVTFDVKDFKGGLPVYFFVGNGQAVNPIAYSSMLGFQVDFEPAAK